MHIKTIQTSNKNFILKYFGWKKNRNKNWDGGYLYYPFLHSTTVKYNYVLQVHSIQWNAGMGNTDTLIPIFVSVLFPSLHLKNKIFVTSDKNGLDLLVSSIEGYH